MGHSISVNGLQNAPKPKTKRELLRLLGLANYYREHVPKFAKITGALYKLIQESVEWVWEDSAESAFTMLKNWLTSPAWHFQTGIWNLYCKLMHH